MISKLYIILILIFLCSRFTQAQTFPAGNTNQGTDFWFSFPVGFVQSGATGAIKIYVSCESAVQCTLEIPGIGKIIEKTTIPNGIIEFSLSPAEAQPYLKDDKPANARSEEEIFSEGKGRGVHISAPIPITVYCLSYFKYTVDSFLALPTSALGNEYIVGSYADLTASDNQSHYPSQCVIVGAYDKTSVSFTLGGSSGTKTIGGMNRGDTKTFILNKGDIVTFGNKKVNGIYADISGSKISATKPISVISGNQCSFVDVQTPYCDFLMEMELPTNTWGKEFHVTRIANRKKYSFVKIFAKNPNTKVYRDGNPTPFTVIATSGGNQGSGYFEGRILNDGTNPRPIKITADGPISISQFNPGQMDDNVSSDPFQITIIPVEQYQKETTVFPLQIAGEPSSSNNLNLVFETNGDGTMPDDLEVGTVNNGVFLWKRLGVVFGFTSEAIKGSKYSSKIIQLTNPGVYKFRALKPIGAYLYSPTVSYGHPASAGLRDLTKPGDIAPPAVTYTQDCNGNILNGKVTDNPNDFTTRSNLALVTLLKETNNYILEKQEFVAGDAVTAWWKLRVEDPLKDAQANIYFSDRAGNDTSISIQYTPPSTSIDKQSLDFGLLKINSGKTLQFTVRNTSATKIQTITHLALPSDEEHFSFVTPPVLPQIVQPLEIRNYDISFKTPTEGVFKSKIDIEIDACTKLTVDLKAQSGEPIINVNDIDFGMIKANTPTARTLIVKNIGTAPLTITGISGLSAPEFSIHNPPSEANPTILAVSNGSPGGKDQTQFTIEFSSSKTGSYLGEIHFKSDSREDGVDDIAILSARAEEPLDIISEDNNEFAISPNPASGDILIMLPPFKNSGMLLKIFDELGNEIADLTENYRSSATSSVRFKTGNLSTGVYFVRFTDGELLQTRPFLLKR